MALSHESRGSGTPLVLLHAFPLARKMWQSQHTLANGCRLILPDLPGFGESAVDPNITVEGMANAVAGLLDQLQIHEPVILGGCSMGGYVTMAFARKYADRLKAILLIDTRPEPDDEAARANRNKMIDSVGSLMATNIAETMLPRMLSATTRTNNAALVEEYRRQVSVQQIPAIIAAQRAMRDRPDSQEVLGQIRVPTLAIVGEDDVVTPPDVVKRMAERIPGSQFCVIPKAGHLPNFEQPDLFNEVVGKFVASLPK